MCHMSIVSPLPQPLAVMGGLIGTGLREVTSDLGVLDGSGRWAVALPYSGAPVLARFERWRPGVAADVAGTWRGPQEWNSSMSHRQYLDAVAAVRADIRRGRIYQVNITRVLSGVMDPAHPSHITGLHALLDRYQQAPYSALLSLPDQDVHISSASPELFLARNRQGVRSGPIKGTATSVAALQEKDFAENVMIVDLVRNDLGHVCEPGSVAVPRLLEAEAHPGLVHLVSEVAGDLRPGVTWAELLGAAFPPGSVTGAPRHTASQVIAEQESAVRDYYCGAIGWVDADSNTACLAVAIRTFWLREDRLFFGTGAGITWGSNPQHEWEETCLKADRLIDIARRTWSGAQDSADVDATLPSGAMATTGSLRRDRGLVS